MRANLNLIKKLILTRVFGNDMKKGKIYDLRYEFHEEHIQDLHPNVISNPQVANRCYMVLDTMADKIITAKDLVEKKVDFALIDIREADEVAQDGGATIEVAVN